MRRTIIVVTTVLLAMAVYVANFTLWASKDVTDQDVFVAATLTALASDDSASALGEIVATRIIERDPSLVAIEPTLTEVLDRLVANEEFSPALEDVARQIHDVVVNGSPDPVVVDLGDHREVILAEIDAVSPQLGAQIPESLFANFVVLDAGELPNVSDRVAYVDDVSFLSVVLVMALLSVVVLYLRSGPTWMAVTGTAFLLAGAATGAIVPLAREASKAVVPTGAYRIVGVNVYDVIVADLVTRSRILMAVGAILVVAGAVLWMFQRRSVRRAPEFAIV